MIREVRFPVFPNTPARAAAEPPPIASFPYFVLEFDDATFTVRHPTTGRSVTYEAYRRDPERAQDWLRGIKEWSDT